MDYYSSIATHKPERSMNQATFNEYTFQQALARARAREAAELAAIAAGNGPSPPATLATCCASRRGTISTRFFPGREPFSQSSIGARYRMG